MDIQDELQYIQGRYDWYNARYERLALAERVDELEHLMDEMYSLIQCLINSGKIM